MAWIFVAELLADMRKCGHGATEAQAAAEPQWVGLNKEVAASLLGQANLYYTGANILGKPSRMLVYLGGDRLPTAMRQRAAPWIPRLCLQSSAGVGRINRGAARCVVVKVRVVVSDIHPFPRHRRPIGGVDLRRINNQYQVGPGLLAGTNR